MLYSEGRLSAKSSICGSTYSARNSLCAESARSSLSGRGSRSRGRFANLDTSSLHMGFDCVAQRLSGGTATR
ncbi:hypothetical protein Y032_0020g161 [Ancylostoma ceylanicum]|uniref:Uncharacterized protein n=1 Tax=Ancylostoma ceylanicum TaxID=53326 RepID=A0A016V1T5_9BILA|nr:hypothetical protein Y032_0020g161 [Ancylostoma ceylanicum]